MRVDGGAPGCVWAACGTSLGDGRLWDGACGGGVVSRTGVLDVPACRLLRATRGTLLTDVRYGGAWVRPWLAAAVVAHRVSGIRSCGGSRVRLQRALRLDQI